mgnify:CR=1 FL=1
MCSNKIVTVTKKEYLKNPCRAASVPYWKFMEITVPNEMKILHHDDYREAEYQQYTDTPYFRLIHDLQDLSVPSIPEGFSICNATLRDFAEHINKCYESICISESELQNYIIRRVYNADLWLAVKNNLTGEIAATGIGEFDREVGEGVLEWIQVSRNYRRCGLGGYIVGELLCRIKKIADFATVSGQCGNPTNPQKLYRRCGFVGEDIWHILRKKV